MIQHCSFSLNTQGTDFFVGDLHGEYFQLMCLLERRGFDFSVDRLFAVGDLIDRGPDSLKCLTLLNEPWFFSTLGNHEAMLLRGLVDAQIRSLHLRNGGVWIQSHTADELKTFATLIERKMPLSMTVETPLGQIGVVHAAAPNDWSELVDGAISDELRELCLWSTQQFQRALIKQAGAIAGIDRIVHGHVNCLYVEQGANQIWLDTLLQSGRLSLRSATQLFDDL